MKHTRGTWERMGDAEGVRSERRPARPLRLAIGFGVGYAVVCVTYIVLSGRIVEAAALSKGDLARVEEIKGLVFVLSMAVLVFLGVWWALRRAARDAATILEQQNTVLDASRVAMAGAFAASVAHDIRNVVMIAGLELEKMRRRHGLGEQTLQTVGHIEQVVGRIRDLSWRLLLLGRESQPGRPEPLDLGPTIRDGLELARGHAKVRECELSVQAEKDLFLEGHRSAIQETLLNLVLNAADATEGRGRIEIRARSGDGEHVLEVHDDGPGVPPEAREDVFRVFYTTKEDGTGLGLLSVRACAELHGGKVEVLDSPLGGACFRVTLRSIVIEPPVAGEGTGT